MVFDRNNPKVDTRIRITNGSAEIMQKVIKSEDERGHFQKTRKFHKNCRYSRAVFNSFQAFSSLLIEKYSQELVRLLVQTENYIWIWPNCRMILP